MTDITKYKSVAVRIDTHQKLKEIGGKDFRSVSKVIEWLAAEEIKRRKKRKK
jgi:hypothetical protein